MTQPAIVFPGHAKLPEPGLLYHPELPHTHIHPLKGLARYGPYSKLLNEFWDPIRVAVIAPHGGMDSAMGLLDELNSAFQPQERRQYLIEYPGFRNLFRLNITPAASIAHRHLSATVDEKLGAAERPHLLLADVLTKAITSLSAHRSEFDVLLILLPDRWRSAFDGGRSEDFDLHDHLKAVTANIGIPMQIIRDSGALNYRCRCSVMWRLSIALYCKAGGVPWKLAGASPDVAYIGISYAVRPPSASGSKFVTCCSQVFDADGSGLEFVAYDVGDLSSLRRDGDNPFLNRDQMRSVIGRSIRLFQQRHAGQMPKRLVIHKSSEFKPSEIDGCYDACTSVSELELIHVCMNSPWRGVNLVKSTQAGGKPWKVGDYPVLRGSMLPIGPREALLWTQGNAPDVADGRNFYKEGKGIPTPLLLVRYAGHSGWDEVCQETLGLTKMDWNNDSLYDRLPVTMNYAQVLARTIKRIPNLSALPYQFRFFM